MKILMAVDGSDFTVRATEYLATHFDWFKATPELHLLNVRMPIPPGMALTQAERILGHDAVDRYYQEEAQAALAPAEKILKERQIPYHAEYKVGEIAHEICAVASARQFDLIVLGSHGHGAMMNMLLGSVATKVLANVKHIPVLIIR